MYRVWTYDNWKNPWNRNRQVGYFRERSKKKRRKRKEQVQWRGKERIHDENTPVVKRMGRSLLMP